MAATVDTSQGGGDTMGSRDPAAGEASSTDMPDSEERPTMQLQVVLDRLGFSPGVIDGKMGMSTSNAISGFQKANDLKVSGELDGATKQALSRHDNINATRVVTIPEEFAVGRYEKIPDSPVKQAEMKRLGYESLEEKLAERFHTTAETLRMLNPGGRPAGAASDQNSRARPGDEEGGVFAAGQQIRVPNVGRDFIDQSAKIDGDWKQTLRDLGIGTDQPNARRIVVDKSENILAVYGDDEKLLAQFTVTSGSSHDPLPIGEWQITGVAHNPTFSYNPELFWDVPDSNAKQQLPPGPNGPVGVVWIDLSKEHYGIHGTSAPETIGRAQSHGCVRLTNWDAARLAQMVSQSTKVVFQK
ncbi:L,D-transpeptidase family protein [Croceicoccus sp. F390]|uniref:L,D-transpeptidase family protein n=1 Tax=Croceicoccus esteveae TaxID=3075597 RepID=A0ABU2ZL09_9SPHN|nr:L,D-transpeptidase family protein [Croceicoccus sp. F390]MDT0576906.1 L,D-transpeptidase family protein [Croceicoccus sp. F390]